MDNSTRQIFFAFFNEIGIISQLSRTLLETRLPKGLMLPHFGVINHLTRLGDGVTPLALARAFQVPKTTMTHTLGGLAAHGFIKIRANPKDGRSKLVFLTDGGRAFRETAIRALDPDIDTLSKLIPPDRISALLPALEEIRGILDRNRTEDPPI